MVEDDGLRCSGLREGNRCAHGFRASIACWPTSVEQSKRVVPMCCDEERCGELFFEMGGKPYQTPES